MKDYTVLLAQLDSRATDRPEDGPGDPLCEKAAAAIRELMPKAGSGGCICGSMRPDRTRRVEGFVVDKLNSKLDHRCPLHGEKAQPALWGRHMDLVLYVTEQEWESLGVMR